MELDQLAINEVPSGEIAAPYEPHMACVLLLDTSSSMRGAPIASLNKAINDFKEQTSMDELAQKRVDIAIIEFNDTARVVQDFTPLCKMQPVTLSAAGCSAMGEGINLSIDMIKERNRFYNVQGIPYYNSQIIMISIGAPTDDISFAAQRIAEEENKGTYSTFKFWVLGVSSCDWGVLKSLARRYFALNKANFTGFFMNEMLAASDDSPAIEPTSDKMCPLPDNIDLILSDW